MRNRVRPARAFSLVEVTLAIGVIALGAIVLFGLLPSGIVTVRSGSLEEAATEILSSAAADMHQTATALQNSPRFQLPALAASAAPATIFFDAAGSVLPGQDNARFKLVATPCSNPNPRLAVWHLKVAWPVQAASPVDYVENVVVLNRP